MGFRPVLGPDGEYVLEVDKRGPDIIFNPLLNKGTAFSPAEQREFGLTGMVPPHISTLAEQIVRTWENFDGKANNIEKYIYLRSLQDRNETLFYALVRQHVAEMLPIVYTPTVGEAVQKYGHIYRNSRGLFITPDNVDRMDEMAGVMDGREVEVIVVTDSQAILGIGDQGVGGMAIPIGKLSLYTVAAGIYPGACLPVCLDVGTDNTALLADPLYLGRRHWRIKGADYTSFIRRFVEGVRRNFPNAILQWEDFSKQNAFENLETYRASLPSFNDDIQGTGAAVLAGILGAMKIKGEKLAGQRFLIFGAGAAGIGVARQMRDGLAAEGLSPAEARKKIFVVDSGGLVTADREGLEEYKREFAVPVDETRTWIRENAYELGMADTVKNGRVTVLIGVSGQPGTFTGQLVDQLMANTPRPVIFTLSNPTSKSEADPREVLLRTGGAAIVAAGSPFPPAVINGEERRIGQGNNAFIFPGVGLGVLASKARVITNGMFTAAARAMADAVSADRLEAGIVYPPVEDLFNVGYKVAEAVFRQAVADGVTRVPDDADPEEVIRDLMWMPVYARYVRKRGG